MEDKRVAVGEDYVEPELLGPGHAGPRPGGAGGPFPPPPARPQGMLGRLKAFAATALAVLGLALFVLGALLTSTVIGAVIGVPLMLLGALVFFLLFKLLAAGGTPPIIIKRF